MRHASTRTTIRWVAGLAAPLILLASSAAASAGEPATATAGSERVIVRFTGTPALAAGAALASPDKATWSRARGRADRSAAVIRAAHAAFRQAAAASGIHMTVTRDFSQVLDAVAVTATPAAVDRIRAMPGVAAVYPDEMMRTSAVDADVSAVGAPDVWKTEDGKPGFHS